MYRVSDVLGKACDYYYGNKEIKVQTCSMTQSHNYAQNYTVEVHKSHPKPLSSDTWSLPVSVTKGFLFIFFLFFPNE